MPGSNQLRNIPSVTEVLEGCLKEGWSATYSREQIVEAVREALSAMREELIDKGAAGTDLLGAVRRRLESMTRPSLRRVINASGIIVHTNLGRAPLAREALARIAELSGYDNLEFDLESGERGSRESHLEKFFRRLIPAEASLVVNNNAAALLLILNTFAEGKEVLVSRGELVEIGGSFRLPEIMKKSGATLCEVGTTNKTRVQDYRNAINERTGLILAVHPSNFRMIGFTEHPTLRELIALGKERAIPVVQDHGSGVLVDLQTFGIADEPTVSQNLLEGLDAICFSGDKILGGPQAGIVCGKKVWIEKMRANPLFRAFRVSKMVYAALEATLLLHLRNPMEGIPVLSMLAQSEAQLKERGTAWLSELKARIPSATFELVASECFIGGGVAPMKGLASWAVAVSHPSMNAKELAFSLRRSEPPVVARIEADRVFLEIRTITAAEQAEITSALEQMLPKHS
ncbi:MAG TPA: L-seryl-tRNA(Sec) selenium transferase [Acidobacteriota bacterium]|nr:L-seryl-tRNA(Sec) selenium transferase [Acidobacteriota bacterium]